MRILLLNQYFIPEPGAGTSRVFYYAKFLKENGHDVTVISGVPNYPDGKIHKGYKNQPFLKEDLDGIKIYRTLVFPTKYTNNLRRFLNYLIFTISSFLVGIFIRRPDLIIASSPPPSAGVTALLLSYLKHAPLIFEVRDVWPGAAKALGFLKNPFLLQLNLFFEKRIYKRSKYLITVTEDTKEIILSENPFLLRNKIKVVTNGVDLDVFDSLKSKISKGKIKTKFTVIYTGTLGLQQGVDTLAETATLLKNNSNIIFLVYGDGASRGLLDEVKKKKRLDNLILNDVVSYKKVVDSIKSADLGLTILKKNKYLDAAYPVKAFDYMAAAKPILVSGSIAMKNLIEKYNLGYWVQPEKPDLLAEKILEISTQSKDKLGEFGHNGRRIIEKEFNRRKQAEKILEILDEIETKR